MVRNDTSLSEGQARTDENVHLVGVNVVAFDVLAVDVFFYRWTVVGPVATPAYVTVVHLKHLSSLPIFANNINRLRMRVEHVHPPAVLVVFYMRALGASE